MNGSFEYALGIDPGLKTWNATVRHTIETGKEVNMITSSKRYHWNAKQRTRNSKAKRWTKDYVAEEQNDLNNRNIYPATPSPIGQNWLDYIRHRVKMMKKGMEAYATAKYARLGADKHIQSQRAVNRIAGKLVNYRPALIFMGNVDASPNSPIRIKKNVKCPGLRKLTNAFRKRRNCIVMPVDEYFSSQTCAKCYGRFDRNTLSHRFKKCHDCRPTSAEFLPPIIVSNTRKRDLQANRVMDRQLAERYGQPIQLLSKVMVHHKNWIQNPDTGVYQYIGGQYNDEIREEDAARPTVWNRCKMYPRQRFELFDKSILN